MTLELDPIEVRVLGCLIEKERATPQNYPLTLNALRLATNQSTNRYPVVEYDDLELEETVAGLKERGLLRFVYSPSNRATKYRQVLDEAVRLESDEIAVLGVLFLRGPQTVGEIKGRSDRLHAFADLTEVQATLDRLAARDPEPFVRRLERQPGQKDARYAHLLGDVPPEEQMAAPVAVTAVSRPAQPDPRIDELESEVRQLKAAVFLLREDVDALRAELGG